MVQLQPQAASVGTLEVFCPWNNTAGTAVEGMGEEFRQLTVSEAQGPSPRSNQGLEWQIWHKNAAAACKDSNSSPGYTSLSLP